MRYPRHQIDFEKRKRPDRGDRSVAQFRHLPLWRSLCHAAFVHECMSPLPRGSFWNATDECPIRLFDVAQLECLAQTRGTLGRLRERQNATRRRIESLMDAEAQTTRLTQYLGYTLNRIVGRMGRNTTRFIDDEKIVVFVDDPYRSRLYRRHIA